MLYSTGPAHIYCGFITTSIGMINLSSFAIGTQSKTTLLRAETNFGTSFNPPPLPPSPPSPFFAAIGRGPVPLNGAEAMADIFAANQAVLGGLQGLGIPGLPQVGPDNQGGDIQGATMYSQPGTNKLVNEPSSSAPKPFFVQSATVFWLGTCEVRPKIFVRRKFRGVYTSDTGRQVDYDKAYAGRDALIITEMNNWNENAYAAVATRLNAREGVLHRGVDTIDSIGGLLLSEGYAFLLFIQFPYSGKTLMAAGGMPAGYRFFAAYPLEEVVQPGLKANTLRLMWHALKVYDPLTGNQWLFDHDMSLVPPVRTVYG